MRKYIEIQLIKILVVFYTITALISLSKKTYFKIKGFGYEFSEWSELILEGVLDWVIVLLFMISIAITTKILIYKKVKWKYIISIHLFLSFFIGIAIYFLTSLFYLITGEIAFEEISIASYFASIISVVDLNFLIYFSMISIVYTFYYFQKTKKNELEKTLLSQQLTNAKMNVLKYQLHPHFLFNTLNSISSLIESDSKLAQDTIANFGDLLRDLLDLKDTNLIPLEEEMNISKRYLDIMALRFSDHLNVILNIEKSICSTLVPSLILLPILENSIKHGYSYEKTNLEIELFISKVKNKVKIQIKNNGAPLKKSVKYGHGLQNTIDRLKLLYKSNYKYTLKNIEKNKGVVTTIIIPSL